MRKQLLFTFSILLFVGYHLGFAQTWVQKSTGVGYNAYRIHFPSANVGYTTVYNWDNGGSMVLKTTDGANTFTPTNVPFSYYGGVHFTNDLTGYAVGRLNSGLSYFAKTVDGGDNWTSQQLAGDQLNDVDFYDANNGIAVGYYGSIFTTNDAGVTWTPRHFNPTYIYEDVEYIDATHIWMTGNTYPAVDSTWAFFSSDGGVTWTKKMKFLLVSPDYDANNSICFTSINEGWIVGYSNRILHTSDGGNNWEFKSTGGLTTTATFTGVSFLNANEGWVTGTENSSHFILRTTDGGSTWTRTNLPDDSYGKIQMVSPNKGYCSGGGGKFFKYTVNGSALNFDGANDDVRVPGINLANSSFTMETWAKRNSSGTYDMIFGQGSLAQNEGLHIGFRDNNTFTFAFFGDDITTAGTYTDNNWHHWAVTYDATTNTQKLYLDGNLINTRTSLGDYIGTGDLFIGNSAWSGNNFSGDLDEIRIWNIARSQCEIKSYMNCEIPSTSTGLIVNYHFNQGIVEDNNSSINTLNDISGNTNNGTLQNFALNGTASNWISPGAVNSGFATPLNLTTSSDTTAVVCGSFDWYGNIYSTSGDKIRYELNNNGCDSVITLHLTVNPSPQITANSGNVSICGDGVDSFGVVSAGTNTYLWYYGSVANGGRTLIDGSYDETGFDTDTLTIPFLLSNGWDAYYVFCEVTNEFNCTTAGANDTISAFELPIVTATSSETTVCAGTEITLTGDGATTYAWSDGVTDGVAFPANSTHTFTVTGTDINNCENTATIDITVNAMPSVATTLTNETITATETGVTYQWLDCNNSNAVITGETNQDFTATVNGNYAVELNLNGCIDTSDCVAINTVGLKSITNNFAVNIYPNPAKENITVETDLNATISVVNVIGQTIIELKANTRSTKINTGNLISGTYFVKVVTEKGTAITKLIIE